MARIMFEFTTLMIPAAASGRLREERSQMQVWIACFASLPNIITFDMGGTSIDVSLIEDGKPQLSNERLVEGYPGNSWTSSWETET